MAAWSAGSSRRPGRIGVEAATSSQTDEALHGAAFEPLLQFHGVAAGVEDKQKDCGPFIRHPTDRRDRLRSEDGVSELVSSQLREHTGANRVAEDVNSADLSGVSGTPTFFINGRRHYGAYDTATLAAAVRAAKARATVATS